MFKELECQPEPVEGGSREAYWLRQAQPDTLKWIGIMLLSRVENLILFMPKTGITINYSYRF